MFPKRLVTVFHDTTSYCFAEEWDKQGNKTARWHNGLTPSSIRRIARVVGNHSLKTRPFYAGCAGYVAEMPACIIT